MGELGKNRWAWSVGEIVRVVERSRVSCADPRREHGEPGERDPLSHRREIARAPERRK
jgi:hypothetical protein